MLHPHVISWFIEEFRGSFLLQQSCEICKVWSEDTADSSVSEMCLCFGMCLSVNIYVRT